MKQKRPLKERTKQFSTVVILLLLVAGTAFGWSPAAVLRAFGGGSGRSSALPAPTAHAFTPAPAVTPGADMTTIQPLLALLPEDMRVERLPEGVGQLVVVQGSGKQASVLLYELIDGKWYQNAVLDIKAYVGSAGIGRKQKAGDNVTPIGLYDITTAFYWGEAPDTGLDTIQITRNTVWVDDTRSGYYNQILDKDAVKKDWSDEQVMYEKSIYKIGFCFGYASDSPKMGATICCRLGDGATGGSIAFTEYAMRVLIGRLDQSQQPMILIID